MTMLKLHPDVRICSLNAVKEIRVATRLLPALACYIVATLYFCESTFGQNTDMTLTFAARPPEVMNKGHATTFTGHAFLIIGVKTNSGIKEDVFGFYPVSGGM